MISPAVPTAIIEDEPLARRALRTLIGETEWLDLVGEAEDGARGVALIETKRPELIFLDIELPGLSGIDVLAQAGRDAVVVFTTAFDDYALIAFELGAIDYVRKPFGRERFERAIVRAAPQIDALRARGRQTSGTEPTAPVAERLGHVREGGQPLKVIYVRERGAIVPIPVPDVQRLEADGDFVAVHTRGRRYLVCVTLSDLARRLDPTAFLRVHRSHVVNLSAIAEMTNVDPNRIELRMRDGSRVVASRTGTRVLRNRVRLVR